MEIEEVLEFLDELEDDCEKGLYNAPNYRAAIWGASKALYKQEPMKPTKHVIEYRYRPNITVAQCSSCHRRLRTTQTTAKGDSYCSDCGQKIDWS